MFYKDYGVITMNPVILKEEVGRKVKIEIKDGRDFEGEIKKVDDDGILLISPDSMVKKCFIYHHNIRQIFFSE